jgi:small subunit ribosomal protein S2
MSVVSMKQLLEAGVHFGHQTFKWNPKMKKYIFIKRNGIHIIDLKQTVDAINEAYQFLKEIANRQEYILFVGTKKQAQAAIREAGEKAGVFYVNQRWYGGMLTNMATIRQSIEKMKYYEEIVADGTINNYTKLEQQKMKRMHDKIEFSLGGIRDMDAVPGAIFVVDTGHEEIAVHEARILGVPIIAMVDTNCDPDLVDYVNPSNDDATRAIQLITDIMANAVLEGKNIATEGADVKAAIEEEPEEFTPDLVDMAAAPLKDIEPEDVVEEAVPEVVVEEEVSEEEAPEVEEPGDDAAEGETPDSEK